MFIILESCPSFRCRQWRRSGQGRSENSFTVYGHLHDYRPLRIMRHFLLTCSVSAWTSDINIIFDLCHRWSIIAEKDSRTAAISTAWVIVRCRYWKIRIRPFEEGMLSFMTEISFTDYQRQTQAKTAPLRDYTSERLQRTSGRQSSGPDPRRSSLVSFDSEGRGSRESTPRLGSSNGPSAPPHVRRPRESMPFLRSNSRLTHFSSPAAQSCK